MMALEKHYEYVLTQRLVDLRKLWRDAYAIVRTLSGWELPPSIEPHEPAKQSIKSLQAELHEYVSRRVNELRKNNLIPFERDHKKDERTDKSTREKVAGLFHWIKLSPSAPRVNGGAVQRGNRSNVILRLKSQPNAKEQRSNSPPHSSTSPNSFLTDGHYVLNDAVYYQARRPTLYFRHSFTPSFGATFFKKEREVRDKVCASSECLLFCEDVIQTALLHEGRTPVILMNPLVQVAYEKFHFDRLTGTSLYTSPKLFYFTIRVGNARRVLERVMGWLLRPIKDAVRWVNGGIARFRSGSSGAHRELRNPNETPTKSFLDEVYNTSSMVSAADDLLYHNSTDEFVKSPFSVRIGHRGLDQSGARRVEVDFLNSTIMTCSGYVGNEIAILFSALYRIAILLAIALQLAYLYRDLNAGIQAKFVAFIDEHNRESKKSYDAVFEEEIVPSSPLTPYVESPSHTFAVEVEDGEVRNRKSSWRWMRLTPSQSNLNEGLKLLTSPSQSALSPEERLWVKFGMGLRTRSRWWTFCRTPITLPRGPWIARKIAPISRIFGRLSLGITISWISHRKCMSKLGLKIREIFRNRRTRL
ncbi:unnamed protein product [Phytomonas sp. Hart1]|nr:unnamed protein product [Phytomonas sp. Hart1]|eukprot:CCW66790.1 unnamed protein product [Phytomonas sp. isolate Hart1]